MPATEAVMSARMTLQVGEKQFITTRDTLSESALLTDLFAQLPADETELFIDGDPTLFEHVLRYLRTGIFPLFYDNVKGYDIALYLELLGEARFYQIDRLEAWISNKCYVDAIDTKMRLFTGTFYGEQTKLMDQNWKSDDLVQVLHAKETVEKCWKCPADKWQHDGHRQACVQGGCILGQIRAYREVDMKVVRLEAIVRSVQVNEDVCLARDAEPVDDPPPYQPTDT